MTEAAAPPSLSPRRSWSALIARRVMGRWGARIGLAWVALVAFCGVFAPFLANSFPFIAHHTDGSTTYPLFRYLKPVDVALPIITLFTLILFCPKRLAFPTRLGLFALLTFIALITCYKTVTPPGTTVYADYRVAAANGEIESAVYPPIVFSPSDRLRDQTGLNHPYPPSLGPRADQPYPGTHWMGTERTGSDILSKMIHACRIAMAIGFIATGIALIIGVFIGGLMGYFSGLVDLLGMRLVEVFEAIPQLFLLLTFVAVFDRNLYLMMVIIGVTGWTGYARFTRAEFLRLRKLEYIEAARANALPLHSILFKHLLPNGVAPVLVSASFGVASAILYESTLSFLGLGLVDAPSWGQLLEQATGAGGGFYWWLATFPGLAIFLTVFAYNLIGEALRDALDPRALEKA